MISPAEIKARAERLYPQVIQAWLDGQELFPHVLRSSKKMDADISRCIAAVQALRNGSKVVTGTGYTVEWVQRRLRGAGRNEVPHRILFENRDDLLQLIGRTEEFAALQFAVATIRRRLPQLETWLRSHIRQLMGVVDIVDDLVNVTEWFQQHPRPNCFSRELPLDVDSKFVERQQNLLRQWFDVQGVLPSDAIRADESQFERRYGLRDREPLLILRFLDESLQHAAGIPFDELALPLASLAQLNLRNVRVFIVENRTNVRTFPRVTNAVVLEGRGKAVSDLRDLEWLHQCDVVYWGDVDVDGLEILSQFRRLVPTVRSLMMDIHTLNTHHDRTGSGNGRQPSIPALLRDSERAAFRKCAALNMRLEQERIPQPAVLQAASTL